MTVWRAGNRIYLSHSDVSKLRRKWKDSEKLDLTEGGLQQLVVGLNGVMSDVKVTGNAAQVCYLQVKVKSLLL